MKIQCPNHEGNFDCTPFCNLCEGEQEYEKTTTNERDKMTTTAEKKKDHALAIDTLDRYAAEIQNGNALILISQEIGKGLTDYFRVSLVYQTPKNGLDTANLTWAISKAFGFTLRDKNGWWYLGIGGYGYSKTDHIARFLGDYYNLDRINYRVI